MAASQYGRQVSSLQLPEELTVQTEMQLFYDSSQDLGPFLDNTKTFLKDKFWVANRFKLPIHYAVYLGT